jgi:hypothetical protein
MATPSPNVGLSIFILLTIPYFIFQYKTKEKHSATAFISYMIILFIIQLGINMWVTKGLCGEVHAKNAFIYTLFPWVFIFGIMYLMITIFPGWLSPFSNTFGYGVTLMAKINDVLGKILKSKEQTTDKDLSETLAKIYDKPSLLINEIPNPNTGFDDFWQKMDKGNLLNSDANREDNGLKEQLRNLVRLKFIVSKSIWFLLTGILTVSTSYNYLIQSSCETSVKEMERRHDDYKKLVEEKPEDTEDKRVYSDYGH